MSPSPDEIDVALREVLSSGPYKIETDLDTSGGWIRVLEWSRNLLQWLEDLRTNQPVSFALLYAVLLVVLVLLVWHIAYTIKRAGQFTPFEPNTVETAQLETPADALRRSEQAAEQSRYVDALRWRLRALLMSVDRLSPGMIRAGYTYWECVAACREDERLAEPVEALVRSIDSAWYGNRTLSVQEYEELRSKCDRSIEGLHPS